jgi:hypothetical protein
VDSQPDTLNHKLTKCKQLVKVGLEKSCGIVGGEFRIFKPVEKKQNLW